jgi:hypothetical protein
MINRMIYAKNKEPHAFYSLLLGIPLVITVLFYGISQTYYAHLPNESMFHPAYFIAMGFFLFLHVCLCQKLHYLKVENIPASKRWENTYPNIIGAIIFGLAISQI